MKIAGVHYLVRGGRFEESPEWRTALNDVLDAIAVVTWPPDGIPGQFIIHPQSGKHRQQGNGVRPIKLAFLEALADQGWSTSERQNPDRFDAVSADLGGRFIGMEWETGNISSSHRSINRFVRAWLRGDAWGGILVLPTRHLARYLTDRIGNWEELAEYLPVWNSHVWERGAIAAVAFEQDGESLDVPRIAKSTDGRALL